MTRDRYGRGDEGGFPRRREEADMNTYDRDRSYRRPFSRTREYDYDDSYRRERERFEAGRQDYAGGRGDYGSRPEYPYNESRNLGEEGYGYQGDTRGRERNEFRDRGRRGF